MYEALGGSTYQVADEAGYHAAYQDWIDEEYNGAPAGSQQSSPDNYPCTITFRRIDDADFDSYHIENVDKVHKLWIEAVAPSVSEVRLPGIGEWVAEILKDARILVILVDKAVASNLSRFLLRGRPFNLPLLPQVDEVCVENTRVGEEELSYFIYDWTATVGLEGALVRRHLIDDINKSVQAPGDNNQRHIILQHYHHGRTVKYGNENVVSIVTHPGMTLFSSDVTLKVTQIDRQSAKVEYIRGPLMRHANSVVEPRTVALWAPNS